MFRFAIKNIATKRVQVVLVILSVILSASVAVTAFNTAEQVQDGITGTAGYYSLIVGPSGSQTQLAMNTLYFTDEPLGTIPYSVVTQLASDSRVKYAIPYAMADSYNGYSCVGTTPQFLAEKPLAEGEMFDKTGVYQVVVGATVAKTCELQVGDIIYTSHAVGDEHHTPLTVVGILQETHTVYDKVVFTQLKTIWEIHESEEEEGEEEHDHEEMNGMVCAVVVVTNNLSGAMTLLDQYDGTQFSVSETESYSLQAVNPTQVMRGVLEDTDNTKYLVYILCAVILLMNILVISIITLLNMYHSAKEIALMRLIGIGMRKINLVYLIQNGLVGLVSVVCAFLLSRVFLAGMGSYVADMGVVLSPWHIYPAEWLILAVVWAISVLPTLICTRVMAKRDSLAS